MASLLASLFKSWIGEQQANSNAVQLGAAKQALATESQANDQVKLAAKARDDFKPYTADAVSKLQPGSDPNFRD